MKEVKMTNQENEINSKELEVKPNIKEINNNSESFESPVKVINKSRIAYPITLTKRTFTNTTPNTNRPNKLQLPSNTTDQALTINNKPLLESSKLNPNITNIREFRGQNIRSPGLINFGIRLRRAARRNIFTPYQNPVEKLLWRNRRNYYITKGILVPESKNPFLKEPIVKGVDAEMPLISEIHNTIPPIREVVKYKSPLSPTRGESIPSLPISLSQPKYNLRKRVNQAIVPNEEEVEKNEPKILKEKPKSPPILFKIVNAPKSPTSSPNKNLRKRVIASPLKIIKKNHSSITTKDNGSTQILELIDNKDIVTDNKQSTEVDVSKIADELFEDNTALQSKDRLLQDDDFGREIFANSIEPAISDKLPQNNEFGRELLESFDENVKKAEQEIEGYKNNAIQIEERKLKSSSPLKKELLKLESP